MFGDSVLGFGLAFTLQDKFSNVARGIQANLASFSSNAENFTNRVNTAIGGMQTGFATLAGGAAVLAPLGFAVSKAMDFEAQLSSIKAVTGASQTMLDQYKDLALEAGAATKYSALEAAQGIEELAKAGVATEKIMGGGLQAALNLATMGEISVAQAAEIASTALNAFNKDNLSLEGAANILAGAANASATSVSELKFGLSSVSAVASGMGFTFNEVNTALAVLAQNGLKGSDAGTSLKTMLQNLQPDTKEQIKLFKELGIITADNRNQFLTASGGFRSISEISGVLQEKLAGLNTAARAKALETMFGSDAVRAANIFFGTGIKGFQDMNAEMKKTTVAAAAAEKMNNLKGSIEQLSGSFETAMIIVGSTFTPTLRVLVDVVGNLVDGFAAFASTGVGQTLLTVVGAIGASVAVTGAAMVAMNGYRIAVATLNPLLNIAMTNLQSFGAALMGVRNSIVGAIRSTYGLIVSNLTLARTYLMNPMLIYQRGVMALVAAKNMLIGRFMAVRMQAIATMTTIRGLSFAGVIQSIRGGLIPALTSLRGFLVSGALFSGMGIALIGLAYAGYKAYEAFQSFDKIISGEKRADTGLLGFFQKTFILGQAVVEMFQNVDKEGVAMSANLHNALKSLGLENAALGLGAIVYNLYGLWTGMANGFATILPYWDRLFVAIGAIGNSIGQLLLPLFKVFGLVGENATQFDAFAMIGEKIVTFLLAPFKLLVFALEQFSNLLGGTVNFMQDVGILEREKPQQQQMPYMPMVLNESVAKEKAAQFQANQQIYNIANNTNTMATNATNPATTPINVTVVTEVDGQKLNATLKNIEQLNENRQ